MSDTRLEPLDDDPGLEGCGYSWDHTIVELGDSHWECKECGAEGWDDEVTPDA